MALVAAIKHQTLQSHSKHSEAECTYEIITDESGKKYLQLDTYGSKDRQILGKKSQSVRLAPSAIAALKRIIQENGL